jgi:hypothetical protein
MSLIPWVVPVVADIPVGYEKGNGKWLLTESPTGRRAKANHSFVYIAVR